MNDLWLVVNKFFREKRPYPIFRLNMTSSCSIMQRTRSQPVQNGVVPMKPKDGSDQNKLRIQPVQ